jgi:AcrR family transcriptional regulator
MATRRYNMVARADGVAQTREQIVAAAFALSIERLTPNVALADVADRAGVTVRTVLRLFGSREGLFDATHRYGVEQVVEERATPVGDIAGAVATIVSHYELRGDYVLSKIEEGRLDDKIASQVEDGRRIHRQWVRTVFAPQLERAGDAAPLEDLLVVATDVYTWKLLRRDASLSRRRTEQRIETMIRRLVGEEG